MRKKDIFSKIFSFKFKNIEASSWLYINTLINGIYPHIFTTSTTKQTYLISVWTSGSNLSLHKTQLSVLGPSTSCSPSHPTCFKLTLMPESLSYDKTVISFLLNHRTKYCKQTVGSCLSLGVCKTSEDTGWISLINSQ